MWSVWFWLAYRVHAEDDVADVREHVAGRDDAGKGGQLHELLQLRPPLAVVGQVDVGAELDRLEAAVLAASGAGLLQALTTVVRADRVLRVRVRVDAVAAAADGAHLVLFLFEALLETRRLVLGVLSDGRDGTVRDARPGPPAQRRVPVLVGRLLQLRAHLSDDNNNNTFQYRPKAVSERET